jgi:hypothetical protein
MLWLCKEIRRLRGNYWEEVQVRIRAQKKAIRIRKAKQRAQAASPPALPIAPYLARPYYEHLCKERARYLSRSGAYQRARAEYLEQLGALTDVLDRPTSPDNGAEPFYSGFSLLPPVKQADRSSGYNTFARLIRLKETEHVRKLSLPCRGRLVQGSTGADEANEEQAIDRQRHEQAVIDKQQGKEWRAVCDYVMMKFKNLKRGPKPKGERPMTVAERVRRHRAHRKEVV